MTQNLKEIRWKQRFENLQKSLNYLKEGVKITKPSEIEKQGIIKSFEISFELSWKTLKNYLESEGVEVKFPREIIKKSFEYEILEDGELWLEMLQSRNLLVHIYDEDKALEIIKTIKTSFLPAILKLETYFKSKN